MLERAKQYLRPLVYAHRRRRAERLVRTPTPLDDAPTVTIGYIVACGRSGTTILGSILQRHPEVCYLFEPYHLWGAIEPRTDVTNLYYAGEGVMIADADLVTDETRLRFRRAIADAARRTGQDAVIEKTPHNAMRIGFLEALSPGARYAHILRDGVSVARSIARIAGDNTYKISTRPGLNQWWGEGDAKWKAIVRGARSRGYFTDEIDLLTTDLQRGAFEWLVSLLEIDRHRATLADRLFEFRYDELIADPEATLRSLAGFFGIPAPTAWLAHAKTMIGSPREHPPSTLTLPSAMAHAFNELQSRHDFAGRAQIGPGGRDGP